MNRKNFSLKKAFTLAEVLITLGIIGVVAMLTISSLLKHYRVKRTVTLLKSTYSMLSQATNQAIQEYGEVESWQHPVSGASFDEKQKSLENIVEIYKQYLKYTEECDYKNKKENICWKDTSFYRLDETPVNIWSYMSTSRGVVLSNGAKLLFIANAYDTHPSCSHISGCPCIYVYIRTDNKDKYVLGKNLFIFHIYNNLLLPSGHPHTSYISFQNQCAKKGGNMYGSGCTAWVIMNENMDYLKCEDLDWNNKTKCD